MKTSACRLTFSTFLPGESRVAECVSVAKDETMPGSRETQRLHNVCVSMIENSNCVGTAAIGCPYTAVSLTAVPLLRFSHSALRKTWGPTSIKRGSISKTDTGVHREPPRVRKPRRLISSAMGGYD